MITRMLISAVALVAALLALGSRPLLAQQRRAVQVALVDALSVPNARAELIRFAEPGRSDLILLRADAASVEDLAAALAALAAAESRRPTKPGTLSRTTIVSVGQIAPGASGLRLQAGEMLREVRRAPIARIGNLGRGRWSEFNALR